MPLRTRIALLGAAVSAAAILVFSVLIYGLAASSVATNQARALLARADEAAAELPNDVGSASGAAFLLPVDLARSDDPFVEVLGPDGAPRLSTGRLAGAAPTVPATVLRAAAASGSAVATTPGAVPLRVAVRPRRPGDPTAGYVVAGQPLRALDSQLRGLRSFLVLSGIVSFLGALLGNWLVAGRALRPLRTMAATAEEIGAARDFRRRLPGRKRRDEIGLLAGSFNRMLERLQEAHEGLAAALEAQRRFVADASHELRTPLTSIRGNAGLLLKRSDVSAADRAEALTDIAGESERMSRLVQSLLTLARADAGQRLPRATLDLRPLAASVVRQAQALHADRTIALDADGVLVISGNADALRQLLWILLDNAAAHTATGGAITVGLRRVGFVARLTVRDDGPGIAPTDLPHVFDRFYRADRARSGGGAGLGLAIARWIVGEHGGAIEATNVTPHGAEFRVDLPLLAPA